MSIHTQPLSASCIPGSPAINQRLLAGKQEFFGYLRRRLGNQDEAEDVLQNFSLKVIRFSQSAGSEEKINAWMGQILRNTLIDHYRRRAVRQRAEAAYAVEMNILEHLTETDPDSDAYRCLHAALPRLRPDHAEILRRVDLEEEPRNCIAVDLGLTTNAFNVRLHRARRALRQELESSCPSCRDGSFIDCSCG